MTTLLLFLAGLLLLVAGAELLVRYAARLAARLGVSPLVIGLTVVAYGTSAPELAVSVHASLNGQAAMTLGNVVGSNIFNVLCILGISALLRPLVVSQQLVRLDVPLMIGVSLLVLLFALNGAIDPWEGGVLCLGALLYTIFSLWQSRKESPAIQAEYQQEFGQAGQPQRPWIVHVMLLVLGLVLLVFGAQFLVRSAVQIAAAMGLSELIIGLTIIAAGTSLPEVAASVVASLRGERDIAVGNVVGSNLMNLLAVLGLASLVAPGGVDVPPPALRFDLPVMIAVAAACLPIFFTDHLIARWEGALFLGYYLAFMLYVIMAATHHRALPVFSTVMLAFVLPLTGVTLLVLWRRALRAQRQRSGTSTG
jgi:cation:H+ antiporter